jgi:hypothetical protein
MFNIFKNDKWENSLSEIKNRFGLTLKDLPEPSTIEKIFNIYIKDYALSKNAATSLLLRLFVLNVLGAAVIMKEGGKEIDPQDFLSVIELLNASVDFSEMAEDHKNLEVVTSKLNITIESFLEKIGIKRG